MTLATFLGGLCVFAAITITVGNGLKVRVNEEDIVTDPCTLDAPSDLELCRAFAETRGEAAFTQIVKRHQDHVYATCLRILGDAVEAQDAAQVTFLIYWKKAPRLTQEFGLRGWLYRQARFTALHERRRLALKRRHEREVEKSAARTQPAAGTTWERVMPWVDEAIGSIPPALRDAVVLRHLHGMSQEETARALGCSVSAASMRIARGLEMLRALLRKRKVEVTASALAAALHAAPPVTAPAGMSASIPAVCAGQAPISGSMAGLLEGVESAMAWIKVKTAAAGLAAALAVGGAIGVASMRSTAPPKRPAVVRPGIEKCEVAIPAGDYAQIRLEFDTPVPWSCLTAARDGRIRMDNLIGVRDPGGWLELKGDTLSGAFRRFVDRDPPEHRMVEFTVEAAVKDGRIAGTVKALGKSGAVTGTLTPEASLAKTNAVATDKSWDSCLGSAGAGCAAQPAGAKRVSSLAEARAVWRSEDPVPQGLSPLTRFMHTWADASVIRTSGGSGSPVLGDGKVFFYYRLPRPSAIGAKKGQPVDYDVKAKKAGLSQAPTYVLEKAYAEAEEVVVALDAATGKTLWRAVIGIGVQNIQNHKERSSDRTPAYADGRLFVIGRAGFVYAFAAAAGRPLWQAPCDGAYENIDGNIHTPGTGAFALAVADGVVVAPVGGAWTGLDAETGRRLWTQAGGAFHWGASRWVHQGKPYVLAVSRTSAGSIIPACHLVCIDPKTGTDLWTLPYTPIGINQAGVSVYGDYLLTYQFPMKPKAVAYRLTPAKAEPLWEIADAGHPLCVPVVASGAYACVTSATQLRTVELATGKVAGILSNCAVPGDGGHMQAVDDLVLVRPDGSHGGLSVAAYRVGADGTLTDLGSWTPPVGGQTTGYGHPFMFPLVDGRMVLRQYDGIYCWDLRKP
jgi:RNA polymerase sigma factor (sigma-70 family)